MCDMVFSVMGIDISKEAIEQVTVLSSSGHRRLDCSMAMNISKSF